MFISYCIIFIHISKQFVMLCFSLKSSDPYSFTLFCTSEKSSSGPGITSPMGSMFQFGVVVYDFVTLRISWSAERVDLNQKALLLRWCWYYISTLHLLCCGELAKMITWYLVADRQVLFLPFREKHTLALPQLAHSPWTVFAEVGAFIPSQKRNHPKYIHIWWINSSFISKTSCFFTSQFGRT